MAARQAGGKTRARGSAATPSGRLRIVAGMWRSRVLEIAAAPGLRPTPERVRETLFNWLTPRVVGSRCLDLFAGTGALGLEALSRGAREAVFVEASVPALAVLRRNIAVLGANNAIVHAGDATAFVETLAPGSFDYVFLDPPFADDALGELCRLLDEKGVVSPGGKVYLEQDRARDLPELPPRWTLIKNKTAGNVRYALAAPDAGDQR